MPQKKEDLIELIITKLKKNNSKKINLEKNELTKFVNSLINNN